MKNLIFTLIVFSTCILNAQNTVGTISIENGVYEGYTLIAPLQSTSTYLIDNCGQIIKQWDSSFRPGNSVYLLPNGNLLRAGKVANTDFTFGGVGGIVQLFDWDGNILWNFQYSNTEHSQHHDVFPMPNGNVLILVVDKISGADAIAAGRDPNKMSEGQIFNERIIEVEPLAGNLGNIVWEWNIKNHLIQDFDATRANFGNVENNPNKLDFNYTNISTTKANWLHINSIQYNADLDQIMLSSRLLCELYVIDHSTTTAEAATGNGGTYGKGGDLLYRWGNKEAYRKGTDSDQVFDGQHYPHWIPNGLTDAGKIIVYNNGLNRGYSSIEILNPTQNSPGVYDYDTTNGFSPLNQDYIYTDPVQTDFYSSILSSGQRLPNGNTLICDGDSGYIFEINSSEEKVWEYVNPVGLAGPANQGETPQLNLIFRANKYAPSYAAFNGRTLTPGATIEQNPNLAGCTLSVDEFKTKKTVTLYPNPTSGEINIKLNEAIKQVEVYDIQGKRILTAKNTNRLNISQLESALYFLNITTDDNFYTTKILKQ